MKINYHGTDTPSPEAIAKVRDALFLLDEMNGFRTPFETWRNCEAQITFGDDAATTSIEIAPPAAALVRRAEIGGTAAPYTARVCSGPTLPIRKSNLYKQTLYENHGSK